MAASLGRSLSCTHHRHTWQVADASHARPSSTSVLTSHKRQSGCLAWPAGHKPEHKRCTPPRERGRQQPQWQASSSNGASGMSAAEAKQPSDSATKPATPNGSNAASQATPSLSTGTAGNSAQQNGASENSSSTEDPGLLTPEQYQRLMAALKPASRRRPTRSPQSCVPGPAETSAPHQGRPEREQVQQQSQGPLGPAEVERRVSKALGLIATAHQLAPYERAGFNQALVLWKAIADIPAQQRKQLVERIPLADIPRLWRTAGQRYLAPQADVLLAQGPDFSLWDDFPEEPDQVAVFQGKAAAPGAGPLHMNRFQKAFFLHPDSFELYGRVLLRKGPLGDLLYPLYYKATIGAGAVPATAEVSEMQLEYLFPDTMGLSPAELPVEHRWPGPKPPLYPFSGGLTDYMRPVGPGVYVGIGWKAPRKGKDQGRRFLSFIMAKE